MSIYAKTAAGWVEVAGAGSSKADLTSWGRVVGEPEGAVTSTYYKNDDGSQWQYWEFNTEGTYEIDLGNGGLFWCLAVSGGCGGWDTNGSGPDQGQPGLVTEGLWEFGPGTHTVTVGKAGEANWSTNVAAKAPGPSSIGDYGTQGIPTWGAWNNGRGAITDADATGYKSRITGDELEYAPGYPGGEVQFRPGRAGRTNYLAAEPGAVIIATRIDVEQLAPAPAELAPAPVLGAPVKVSGTADVVEYIVRQTDGTRKKIYMLPGNTTGDGAARNVFEVTLGAGTLNGIMVGAGGSGGCDSSLQVGGAGGGAGGVIGTGANIPIILPVQGQATYTIKVAGRTASTTTALASSSETPIAQDTTIAVQGQPPFIAAIGGGRGYSRHGNASNVEPGSGGSGGGGGSGYSYSKPVPGQGFPGGTMATTNGAGGGGYSGNVTGGSVGEGGPGFDLAAALQLNTSDGPTAAFLAAVSANGRIAGGGGGVHTDGQAGIDGGGTYNPNSPGSPAQDYTGSGGGGTNNQASGTGGCGVVYIITDAS